MRYPLGQPVRLSTAVTDLDGNPAAVTPTFTVQIANADGTTTVTGTYASPVQDSVGFYHQDVPASDLSSLGHYQYTVTAANSVTSPAYGKLDVFDPFETSVLTLADAKNIAKIPQADTTQDAEILSFIGTIETSIEGMTGGPLVNRSITERIELDGSYTTLQVRQRPLVTVTQILSVASGEPLSLVIPGDLDIDSNAGVVRRKLGYPFWGPYFVWLPAMLVTYIAGWGTQVPSAFNLSGRVIFKHLWDMEHGPTMRPQMGGQEMVTLPGWGFAIPNRAAELLDGSLNGMPFKQETYI